MARRYFVIGDPQTTAARFLSVLDVHGLLAKGGMLAPEVGLISIGDHFDFHHDDPVSAGREGIRILRWLAGHDPAQAIILMGNHDAVRVMELASTTDEHFGRARELALDDEHQFSIEFPEFPNAGIVRRDFSSFSEEQRALVIELLLTNRMVLAGAARMLDGREVLITHAGVTTRELSLLGIAAERQPATIAAKLNAFLANAIDDVRHAWREGRTAPLNLEPLHVAGVAGSEGGGLLYHRPSAEPARDTARPRRFLPRSLPRGLTQVAGHTGHEKCTKELAPFNAPNTRADEVAIRSLVVDDDSVVYGSGIGAGSATAATLVMVDAGIHKARPEDYPLLELGSLL